MLKNGGVIMIREIAVMFLVSVTIAAMTGCAGAAVSGGDAEVEVITYQFMHRICNHLLLNGKVLVHSNSGLLNKHMDNNTHLQAILSALHYPETYTFTADRIREA